MGYICFEKEKEGYLLYPLKINASHIYPPKRNMFKQNRMRIMVFWKTLTLMRETLIKVTICVKNLK